MLGARNRLGSVQAAANDFTHSSQVLYHNEQSCKLYWWLNFYLHLGQMRGLNLPTQVEFTQKQQEAKKNRAFLYENFEIAPVTPTLFRLRDVGLMEAEDLDIIAYHQSSIDSVPNAWRRRAEEEWACTLTPAVPAIDPLNPLRLAAAEAPKPGTIRTSKGRRWVAELYSQYETGQPIQPRESQVRRLKWFKQCLGELAIFMHKKKLHRVGFPVFVGCTTLTQREWVHYSSAINDWQASHPEFVVSLHQIA